ncbi:MAG: peroxiredoxin family protein [Gammaproteobacteria bacterium]|nr:peroxiredoxin family protein [Gammaproteobacteria bacterium]
MTLIKDRGAVVALVDPRSEEGKRALAFLQRSQQRLREMKVGVVAFIINVSQPSTVEKLVKDNGLSIPIAHDAGQKVANAYGVAGSAMIAVVDPEGKVYGRYDATETNPNIGPMAMGGVRDMVEAIEAAEAEAAGEGEGEGDGQMPAPAADAAGWAPRRWRRRTMPRPGAGSGSGGR